MRSRLRTQHTTRRTQPPELILPLAPPAPVPASRPLVEQRKPSGDAEIHLPAACRSAAHLAHAGAPRSLCPAGQARSCALLRCIIATAQLKTDLISSHCTLQVTRRCRPVLQVAACARQALPCTARRPLTRCRRAVAGRASRQLTVTTRAMVNVDFASPSLVLGAVLIGAGVLLLQVTASTSLLPSHCSEPITAGVLRARTGLHSARGRPRCCLTLRAVSTLLRRCVICRPGCPEMLTSSWQR